MKKILVLAISLLLLAGCAAEEGYSKLSDPQVLFVGDKEFTEQDLYETLKFNDNTPVIDAIMAKIAEKEDLDYTDLNNYAEQMRAAYESIGAYDEATIDSAIDNIMKTGTISLLGKDYISKNYATLSQEDNAVQAQIASFETEEAAQATIDAVNTGSTFDMAAANNGFTGDSSKAVYLDTNEDLVVDVKEYLNSTDDTGLSTIIPVTDSDSQVTTYYLVNVISRNAEDFTDDYIAEKMLDLSEDDIIAIMLENHEIKFYDQDIYEMMSNEFPVLK